MGRNLMIKCPNCMSESFVVYENQNMPYGIALKDININIEVSICKYCDFIFQSSSYNNQYDTNIIKLYSSYKISNMYHFPNRNFHNLKALDFISELVVNDINYNVLEIGANRGDFLYLLKEKFQKINVLGCEPTEFKNLSLPIINAFFNKDLFNTKFDLVIIRHTLEHIKYPKKFVEEVREILKPGSLVFIEVPNLINSLNNYVEDFTPDHVNFFTINTLANIFDNMNIKKYEKKDNLYVMFKEERKRTSVNLECSNLRLLFDNYKTNMNEIIKEIKHYDRIIFYGISNFYLWTFKKLENHIGNKELYFIDDNVEKDVINGLCRLEEFKNKDLVILCSSNKYIQLSMSKNLPNNVDILYPWKGIEYV